MSPTHANTQLPIYIVILLANTLYLPTTTLRVQDTLPKQPIKSTVMAKTTFVFLLGSAYIIGLTLAASCFFDFPGEEGENSCDGKPLVIPLGNGKSVCCAGYGGISLSTSTSSTGEVTYNCNCQEPAAPVERPTSPGGPATVDPGLDTFRQEALVRHNQLRALHGSPALTLNEELNAFAQAYAEELGQTNNFKHSDLTLPSGGTVGENLATIYGSEGVDYNNGGEPVQAWYDEIKDYDPNNPFKTGGPDTGHFTQVVWKATTELGIGKARNSAGTAVYVVGTYRVRGNDQSSLSIYAENVPALL